MASEKEIREFWKKTIKQFRFPPLKTKKAKELKRDYSKAFGIIREIGNLAIELGILYNSYNNYKDSLYSLANIEQNLINIDNVVMEIIKEGESLLDNWKYNATPTYIDSTYRNFITNSMGRLNYYKAQISLLSKKFMIINRESLKDLSKAEKSLKKSLNIVSSIYKKMVGLKIISKENLESWEYYKKAVSIKIYYSKTKPINVGVLNRIHLEKLLKEKIENIPQALFNLLSALLEFLIGKTSERRQYLTNKVIEIESSKQIVTVFNEIFDNLAYILRIYDNFVSQKINESKLILQEPTDALTRAKEELIIKEAFTQLKRQITQISLFITDLRKKLNLSIEGLDEYKKWMEQTIDYYLKLAKYLTSKRDELSIKAEKVLESLSNYLLTKL